ncbi:MAG: HNH endonuclease [Gammaproteobacteria bacterium]|nr:HNH endonuclease [Gammaproteobacteria bacterium]MDD9850505.1 HNH endonuclease [Gammaproteobacteria bacterium]
MPEQIYKFEGNWFHARTSSSYAELKKVRALVNESTKSRYVGIRWSGGRANNPRLFDFASVIGVQPSTMQTKIRAMNHYGFLADSPKLPLRWTRLGELWANLYDSRCDKAAAAVYRITLLNALCFFAFDHKGYTDSPRGCFPICDLLRLMGKRNIAAISRAEFNQLVDGNTPRKGANASYWRADILNSGLFEEDKSYLRLSADCKPMANIIKNFRASRYSREDIQNFREKQLTPDDLLTAEIGRLLDRVEKSLGKADDGEVILAHAYAETLDNSFLDRGFDLGKTNPKTRYFSATQRHATWGRFVKERYGFSCVVPACDVKSPFVEAAHIKPHSAKEKDTPHRAHILNGLCLCRHCHFAFDRGLFSMDNNAEIILSPKLREVRPQHPRRVIQKSLGKRIDNPAKGRIILPARDFISYHRNHIFQK